MLCIYVQADAHSKQAFDVRHFENVRHFEDAEGLGSAPLPNSPSALWAQLAALQDVIMQLCQRVDDKTLLRT